MTGESDRDKWCPVCRDSVKWYETVCPRCGGGLLDDAAGDAPDPDVTLVPVFDIRDGAVVPLARMALESAGIEYAVQSANVLIPGVRRVAGTEHTGFDRLVPGRIVVRAEDALRARDLLADLQQANDPSALVQEPTTAEWSAPENPARDEEPR